jgi:hypothetical protein
MHPVHRLRPALRGEPVLCAPGAPDSRPAAASTDVFGACRDAFAAALIQICQRHPAAAAPVAGNPRRSSRTSRRTRL